MIYIGNKWDEVLADEFNSDYFYNLSDFLDVEYAQNIIYPNKNDIFNALKYTDFDNVRAVILGQDPYHGKGQAHGLCFSVRNGVKPPPSLKNIFKEIHTDLGLPIPTSGELTSWAKSGVLMLNAVLTVQEGRPNSHKSKGWEQFTDAIIKKLNARQQPTAFILWGANARKKAELITNLNHKVFEAAHPSPLSAHNGFFGCKHFSAVNDFLVDNGIEPICWDCSK